ncbi:hypothetical protein CONLIGDRAFT_630619 [Coniochaeta ligniaria NRRL 30616]|uniref:Uncharacterized protein n=1 Tax=Coniochaeta ligniaria NRRL 30616 TaxID=1408157 RepID=A0A1J7JLD5_9PEZI|nr:hypothetical protein CONLIGDRAFT_630619 [Coniochaeta ligniaria NRRL 30616]
MRLPGGSTNSIPLPAMQCRVSIRGLRYRVPHHQTAVSHNHNNVIDDFHFNYHHATHSQTEADNNHLDFDFDIFHIHQHQQADHHHQYNDVAAKADHYAMPDGNTAYSAGRLRSNPLPGTNMRIPGDRVVAVWLCRAQDSALHRRLLYSVSRGLPDANDNC